MTKLLYKPFGMIASVLSGVLASFLFTRFWKRLAHESEAPKATEHSRGWGEILLAAAIQGAIFGFVKAAVDRGGAEGFNKATGTWPGDD